jgi:hypothetical protein
MLRHGFERRKGIWKKDDACVAHEQENIQTPPQ